jgi:aryl-alcohol dehydrogenase-like predicted oxidoreductase
MHYTRLGKTGLEVSRICLGAMSFGDVTLGQRAWAVSEDTARDIIKTALDGGINFIDTANMYSEGTSEEALGQVLWPLAKREDIVLATKVYHRMRPGPNGGGLSRKAILHELDQSLKRLKTDYIDVYFIHRFDPNTPIEETLETLHDVVKAGKVRYLGASSMHTWRFVKMVMTQRMHGWSEFIAMQDHVNLVHREEEREMLPFCESEGIGVVPWSPLARGRLARPWGTQTLRASNDAKGDAVYVEGEDATKAIVGEVEKIAIARNLPMAQIGLSWLLHKSAITAPIVGATKPKHIEDALQAIEVNLSEDEIAAMEAPYRPLNPVGY